MIDQTMKRRSQSGMSKKTWMRATAAVMSDVRPIKLEINIAQLWLIITAIQAAARHPSIHGETYKRLKDISDQMSQAIIAEHPEAADLLKAGWDRRFDVVNKE